MKSGIRRPWIIMIIQIICCYMRCGGTVLKNEIRRLPGQPSVNFRQFSGYVNVDDVNDRKLFYYFVEAETDPQSRPLVLWLNGGPGCSSVGEGAFVEHGPFRPMTTNSLIANDYSWNKKANILYLESPAGVGFSYSTNTSFYTGIDDEMTARDNLIFLQRWFDMFSEHKNKELFIAGESYAGHYVPQLAQLVIKSRPKINLKGIAIGNPLLEFNTDFNSVGDYLWSHGIITDSLYLNMTERCNNSQIWRQRQILKSTSPVCEAVIKQLNEEFGGFVNPFDVLLDLCRRSFSPSTSTSFIHPLRRSLASIPRHRRHTQEESNGVDVCVEDKVFQYLNRKDVQKAMNARLVGVSNWTQCSNVVRYNMSNLETPTIGIVGELVDLGVRAMIYSGDQDSVFPLIGTRKLVELLATELGLGTAVEYCSWMYCGKVGGWAKLYDKNLTFATIRGASHTAPFTQPESSLHLFSSFLDGTPLVVKVK